AIQLWLFFAFFIDGYGGTGNILGGRLLGAKDYKTLVSMAKRVNIYGFIVACLLGIISLIFTEPLGLIFTKDREVISIFTSFFLIVIIMLPINALAFVGDGIFKGMGETGFLRNVLIGSTVFGFIPMLLISRYFDLQLQGVWIAISVWMLFRGVALVIKFRRKYVRLALSS
ncbi:MAG: MATE family efflux transporter, partial [Aquimarina sp.]|nr:MATE family efflux transporter [Aquimarina sp.]